MSPELSSSPLQSSSSSSFTSSSSLCFTDVHPLYPCVRVRVPTDETVTYHRVASWWPGLTPILYFVNKAAGLGGRKCQWGGLVSIVQSIALPVTVQFFFFFTFFFSFSLVFLLRVQNPEGGNIPSSCRQYTGTPGRWTSEGETENESERWRAWTYARWEVDAVFDEKDDLDDDKKKYISILIP